MFAVALIALLSITASNAASFTSQIDLSNVTNKNISKYIYGMNMYQAYGENEVYTGNYTIGRLGGNAQTRFNFTINAANSGQDYYFITNPGDFTWQQFYDRANKDGLDFWTQIPAMGWIASTATKSWSFSIAKYGAQKSNECSNYPPDTTWCAKDAGNGVWVNGSNVVHNNPYDANCQTNKEQGAAFVTAVTKAYPDAAVIFSIDNEPTLWSSNHRDVHPAGSTYDEIVGDTLAYAAAAKAACNNKCLIAGFSPWGWCGYFEDGYDHDKGFCKSGGPDYIAKGNMPLSAYYLQQLAAYEQKNNQRILDIFDVHYYPAASGVSMSCDESNSQSVTNRLQAPRGLYDPSYNDGSWIGEPVQLIPRFKGYINQYYPGTMLSISEYSFGGDNCITSTIAHSEALAVMATFGVDVATRWSKPAPGSMVTNAFNIFTNYDGQGSNVYSSKTYAVNVMDSNVEMVSSYAFVAGDKSKMFVVLYNKDENNENSVDVSLSNNSDNLTMKGDINVYGVDKSGLSKVGTITPSPQSFKIDIPAWSIRLAVISL